MMRICMYHNVWKCDVLAGENKSWSCWRIELSSSFPLGMMNEDDKPVGEKNSVGGINWLRDYSEGNYSVGKRRSAEDFNDNSVGDSVDKLYWGF